MLREMPLLDRLVQLLAPEQVRRGTRVRLAQYNTYDARAFFSELLERARLGEEILIARSGEPIAKLVPYGGENGRPGLVRAHVVLHDQRTEVEVAPR